MRKRLGIIGLLVLSWGCDSPASEGRAITIAQFGDFFLYAPLYVAIDGGFFSSAGLDVSLVSTGGDETTWATVLSGRAQFGVADPIFIAIAGARGQPGKVVAALVTGVPFWGVTTDSDVDSVATASDLEGLTVATFPSPSTAYALQRDMFEDAGLTPSIREGPPGTLLALLQAGQADVALELEPTVSQVVADGGRIVYSMADLYGDFAITGLTTRPATVQDDPDLVRDVVCGIQRALNLIASSPDSALTLLRARFPEVAPDVAEAALLRAVSAGVIPARAELSQVAWDRAVSVRQEVGDLTDDARFVDYVDNTFLPAPGATCLG